MDINEKIKIEKECTLTNKDEKCLSLLYLPLIQRNAYVLYQVLSSLDGMSTSLNQILQISLFNEGQFDKNRKILEQFQLMRTFYDPTKNTWLFKMVQPKSAEEFLKHDTFGRMFLKNKGATYFEAVKRLLINNAPDAMVEVTESFDVSLLESWNEVQEKQFEDVKMVRDWKQDYSFDFDKFLKNMDFIFPLRLRTQENLTRIAHLASIYGASEMDMKKLVQKNTNPNTRELNFEHLQDDLMKRKVPVAKTYANPYMMPPIQFLASKQTAPLSYTEKQIVMDLSTKYGFINEVVNVLIEYVLKTSNNGFNRNYVETIASSWSRNKVDTYEKAIEQTRWKKKKQTKSDLPEWYDQTPQEKASDEYLEQLLSRQKEMKGEN